MNNQVEYILCAAVREKENKHIFHCGYRHDDVYTQYGNDLFGIDFYDDMGFLTSHGRFVGRREAKQIAINAEQLKHPYEKYDFLTSEMLY